LSRTSVASLADTKEWRNVDESDSGEDKKVTKDERAARGGAQKIDHKSPVLMQVNCRSIFEKYLDFWNLICAYNPDIILGLESWLREEFGNSEIFRGEYTAFRRERNSRGGGVLICVKKNTLHAWNHGRTRILT
jgi:hypothetical protein